ncbi:MAG: PP2C family protein-serine/threonine phosphatase [Planctomycetota bacterium]
MPQLAVGVVCATGAGGLMSESVLVVTSGEADERVRRGVAAVADAWPGPGLRLDWMVWQGFDQPADEHRVGRAAVVWVWGESTDRGLRALMQELGDRHRPVAWTPTDDAVEGGLGKRVRVSGVLVPEIQGPGDQAAAAAATLSGMALQAEAIDELSHEVRLMQAHRSGLSSQVNKLDEELRLAAQIQQDFLPKQLPSVNGVSFHALYRPASYVSGDLYDVEQLDEHHLGFFIADAVGHGAPAALMTIYIKRSLQTKLIHPDLPRGYKLLEPGDALARLNRDLLKHQHGKVRFCTAIYGVIDTRTRAVSLARAGHPFPMLLHPDGRTTEINCDGGLLGVFPDEVFETQHFTLDPGDRLLLYSDGFEVAFPTTDEASGETNRIINENYTDELAELRHGAVETALHDFAAHLDQQAGSLNQRDDLTVLCLSIDAAIAQAAA